MIEMILAQSESSMPLISLPRLGVALLPVLAVILISWRWSRGTGDLLVGTGRMVVQLLLVGYVLVLLFKVENPWAGIGVVLFMIVVSAWIAIRTVKQLRWKAYGDALLAIALGGGVILAVVLLAVMGLDPWYQPRYVIPIAGMIFSNAMTAVTLSAERFESERAGGRELIPARNIAWDAALIPQVNSFLAVGLVALPGMMTGQILNGADPLHAVRYQIMVMAMVMGSAGLAVAIFLSRRLGRESEEPGEPVAGA